ncbi:aldose epimerase [Pararobbsia silviterrae]|uniref:Aldose epimerase n=1 Tax=Pararobbsia silviterrae TaxID=1792498 RepID=A0A494X7R1_9BURK|nr:aldose epimerase [Pararobbsia silviterrae]RKP43763.1 aldose epimerase [Pararobbsia silviterrae]
MTFQGHDILELTLGTTRLRAAPHIGGRLLTWEVGGRDVIHWPSDADWSRPAKIRGGNPLLFPFLGRHRVDGEIGRWRDSDGTVYALPAHGFARDAVFSAQIDAASATPSVTMTLTDSDATRAVYPFAFAFSAIYTLISADTLEVSLVTENRGATPLPYYAGHHFYFVLPHALRGETTIDLPPTVRRFHQADGALSAPEPGDRTYRLDDARIQDRFHVIDAVPAAERIAYLRTPSLGRTVEFDLRASPAPWYAVTTWTEDDASDFFCVEPWLGLPDAIHNGAGLRWIAPGATETATLRLTARFTA